MVDEGRLFGGPVAKAGKTKTSFRSKRSSGVAACKTKSGQSEASRARRPANVRSATHVAVPGSQRASKTGAVRIRKASPASLVEITLTLRGPKMPNANDHAENAITPKDFQARFGASQTDADKVIKILKKFGMKNAGVSLTMRSINEPIESRVGLGSRRLLRCTWTNSITRHTRKLPGLKMLGGEKPEQDRSRDGGHNNHIDQVLRNRR
jgi:hypothetical protein